MNMETTGTIKKIWRNPGTKQNGDEYLLSKVLMNGQYYVTFKDYLKDAKEGMLLNIEYEPGEKPGNNTIKKVIALLSQASRPNGNPPARAEAKTPILADEAQLDAKVAARLRKAKEILHREIPEAEGMSEYPYLLGQLLNELGSEHRQERMIRMDLKKIEAYAPKLTRLSI